MSTAANFDLASIPDRIQSEVQRAIQRSIKGVEYFSTSGPTPIDFHGMKLFSNFADRRYFDVDRLIDSVENMPPEMILSSFEMLRPASRSAAQIAKSGSSSIAR